MSTSKQEEKDKSEWSVVGLASKFVHAWEKAGGTKADINRLAQNLQLLRQIVWMLRGSWELKPKQFPTFHVADLGRHKSMGEFFRHMKEVRPKKGCDNAMAYFGVYEELILRKISWWQTEISEETVLVCDADLGLPKGTYGYRTFLEVAATAGLYECQQETAAALMEDFDQVGPKIPWRSVRRPAFEPEKGRSLEVHIAVPVVDLYGKSILTLTEHGSLAKRNTAYFYSGSHWILSRRKPIASRA